VTFRVLLHPNAAKALKKLDGQTIERMKKRLTELEGTPSKVGKQLHPSDFWSIREGDYRAIYEINPDQKQVTVLFIGHRKKVYNDFSKML
jgi:mRNA-degrading endonuclease RelE of RelBE toxin-antitoxin system